MERFGLLVLFAGFILVMPVRAQEAAPPELTRVSHEEMQTVIGQNEAPLTVVNFWATWCVPCREEFPYFVELGKEFGDEVDVLFVSMDFDDQYDAAVRFLEEQGVEGASYFKQGKDNAFINAFSEDWSGAIPATFLYAPQGRLVSFWEGKVSHGELQDRVRRALDDTDSSSNG